MTPPKRIIVGVIRDEDEDADRLFAVSNKKQLRSHLSESYTDEEEDGTLVWEYIRIRRKVARRKIKEQITITDR